MILCEYRANGELEGITEVSRKDALKLIEKSHRVAMRDIINAEKDHVLYAITRYLNDDIEKILLFYDTQLNEEELDEMIKLCPISRFHVIHKGTAQKACLKILSREKHREIKPITLKIANSFVDKYHRHHNGTVGCKFSIGLFEGDKLIAVAICGRPVSRYLDNGEICEINRCCTRGDENACSKLYGACSRIARNMGYKKIITYTLESESGISLKASGFTCEGRAGGTHWSGKRDRGQDIPCERKLRWSKLLAN